MEPLALLFLSLAGHALATYGVTSIGDFAGPVEGGFLIRVFGSFDGLNSTTTPATTATGAVVQMSVGATGCTSVRWTSTTKVWCTVGPGVGSSLPVSLQVGTEIDSITQAFTYYPPDPTIIVPNRAFLSGGISITILGTEFGTSDSTPTASVGNTDCSVTTWVNAGALTCLVPPSTNASQVSISVVVGGQLGTRDSMLTYYVPGVDGSDPYDPLTDLAKWNLTVAMVSAGSNVSAAWITANLAALLQQPVGPMPSNATADWVASFLAARAYIIANAFITAQVVASAPVPPQIAAQEVGASLDKEMNIPPPMLVQASDSKVLGGAFDVDVVASQQEEDDNSDDNNDDDQGVVVVGGDAARWAPHGHSRRGPGPRGNEIKYGSVTVGTVLILLTVVAALLVFVVQWHELSPALFGWRVQRTVGGSGGQGRRLLAELPSRPSYDAVKVYSMEYV